MRASFSARSKSLASRTALDDDGVHVESTRIDSGEERAVLDGGGVGATGAESRRLLAIVLRACYD